MPRKKKPVVTTNDIQNGFGEAIGFGAGTFGPGGGQGPTRQPVSSTASSYENLRWYMVSNERQLLSQLYVEIDLVQTVVNVPVDDGLRGGVMFKSKQLDEQEIKELQIKMDQENDLTTAGWASKWCRLYGGGGIMILSDSGDPLEEFKIENIKKGDPVEFRAIDMWEMFWDKQNIEGYDMNTQTHDFDYYSYYGEHVHKTRIMRLKGFEAPSFVRPRLRGWGLSVVEPLIRPMNQYLKSVDLTFEVLDEFKIDIYKVKNLVNTLMSPNGTNQVRDRITMTNWQKNYQNAIVMDSEDDYDHKQISFTGLAETMAGVRMQIASAVRMPITKLFGTSVSAGFATDQNDMENYNSMVESEVRQKLKYDILRMASIRCQQLFGTVPDDLELEFKPLRELGAVDQETVKTQKFARLQQAAESGRISNQEYRDACNKGNLFDISLDTAEDGVDVDMESALPEGEEPEANKPDTKKMETSQ